MKYTKLLVLAFCLSFLPQKVAAESTVYFFYDLFHYFESFPIYINGKKAFCMEGKPVVGKWTGTRYHKTYRKCTFNQPGRYHFSYQFDWVGKPYYSDIVLTLKDNRTYYFKLDSPNMWNYLVKKQEDIFFKLMTEKEGKKELGLAAEKYEQNPDYTYERK